MRTTLTVKCPLCGEFLVLEPGQPLDPDDGFMVSCVNMNCGIDSGGHGKTEKAAIEIFKQKCNKDYR